MDNDGIFNLQKGKRNHSYAIVSDKEPASYQLVRHKHERMDNHKANIPQSWTIKQYNEGTFSSAGPSEWHSSHRAGTSKIVIGKTLEEMFPDALKAIRFASDALYFDLHTFYSMPNYLVTEIGDEVKQSGSEILRTSVSHRLTCLRACMNLLNEANTEIGAYHNPVVANHVGWFHNGMNQLRADGHPVEGRDYLVRELSHPSRNIAFVKTEKSIIFGATYILPFNENVEKIVELAFSESMIKKHYPHGFMP